MKTESQYIQDKYDTALNEALVSAFPNSFEPVPTDTREKKIHVTERNKRKRLVLEKVKEGLDSGQILTSLNEELGVPAKTETTIYAVAVYDRPDMTSNFELEDPTQREQEIVDLVDMNPRFDSDEILAKIAEPKFPKISRICGSRR